MTKRSTAHDKQKRDDEKIFLGLQKVQEAFSKLEKHYDIINLNDLKIIEEVRQIIAHIAAKYLHSAKAD